MLEKEFPLEFQDELHVSSELERLAVHLETKNDPRKAFARAYAETSKRISKSIKNGEYGHSEQMQKYCTLFANLYGHGLSEKIYNGKYRPKAWSIANSTKRKGDSSLLLNLLLGINAHINQDLPFCLIHLGMDVNSTVDHNSFLQVNHDLKKALPYARTQIAKGNGFKIKLLNGLFGKYVSENILIRIVEARNNAWANAKRLALARNFDEFGIISKEIEDVSVKIARRMITLRAKPIKCIRSLTLYDELSSY